MPLRDVTPDTPVSRAGPTSLFFLSPELPGAMGRGLEEPDPVAHHSASAEQDLSVQAGGNASSHGAGMGI